MDSYLLDSLQKRVELLNADTDDLKRIGAFGKEWDTLSFQSFDVFKDVQSLRGRQKTASSDQHSRILSASTRYSTLLEELFHTISQGSGQGDDNSTQDTSLESARSLLLMWKLFQTVFFQSEKEFCASGSVNYIGRLHNFQKFVGDPLRKMPRKNIDTRSTTAIWQNMARHVLIGNFSEACDSLQSLNQIRFSRAVQFLQELLEDPPIGKTTGSAKAVLEWRRDVSDLLMSRDVEDAAEVCQILRLLLGHFEEWVAVGHEFTSWLAFYICRLFHLGFFPSPVELSQELKLLAEARTGCRTALHPLEIDSAVEAVLKLNWDETFEILRNYFHNTWFAVHMWDLLDLSGVLVATKLLDSELSIVIREGLIVEYVQVAVRGGSWLPYVRYLKYCEIHGVVTLEKLLADTGSFGSEEERRDVLSALEADGMTSAVYLIHQREAFASAKVGDFEQAMESANMCDVEFRCQVANMYIESLRRHRGWLDFRNSDRPVMYLLPDEILRRLGVPGLSILCEKALRAEDDQKTLQYLAVLLMRMTTRAPLYQTLQRVNDCFERIRSSGNTAEVQVYRQLRTWLMKLPLTNLKPATENEKFGVRELEKEVFKAAAWSFDQFSTYAERLYSLSDVG